MNLFEQKRDQIIQAAYEWRAADVHAAACRLGIRVGNIEVAEDDAEDKLRDFLILLDSYHSDLTST